MASSPAANQFDENISYFRKTVTLRDWWLIKADDDDHSQGKRLGVAGFTVGEQKAAARVFYSAPISKRSHVFYLETADGIVVILQGFINKNRTIENGFPPEIFSHFLFGFPPNWEEHGENYLKQAVTTGIDSKNTSDLDMPTNNSENQNEENEDGVKSGITDTMMSSAKQSEENEDGVIKSGITDTMMSSAKQSDAEVDDITPSKVKLKRRSKATLLNSGNLTCKKIMDDLKDNRKQKDVAELPRKQKNKQSPEVSQYLSRKGLKKCSRSTGHAESNIQHRMLKASRALKNSPDSLKSIENPEKLSVKGGSSTKKARRRISFDKPAESPRTQKSKEQTCIVSPESLKLKRSRSGRLLLPTLEFWRNQIPIYDADRTVTGIQEELSSSVGTKSEPKKQKKRH